MNVRPSDAAARAPTTEESQFVWSKAHQDFQDLEHLLGLGTAVVAMCGRMINHNRSL